MIFFIFNIKENFPMKKDFNALLSLMVGVIVLFLAGTTYAKTEIKLGHSAPVFGDKTEIACQAFKKYVETNSSSEILINIFPNNQLGNERELLEGLQMGTVEMAAITTGSFPTFYPEIMVLDIPYLFSSSPVAWAVLDGPFGDQLRKGFLAKTHVNLLAFGENGYRNFTNSARPIKTPEDLKGLKIRTMENPAHLAMMKAMGAIPTPMPYGELYTALAQHVVDGQENPISLIKASKFYEVQKYLTVDGHVYSPHALLINDSYLNNLSEPLRKIIVEGAKVWQKTHREYSVKQNKEGLDDIKASGTEVYTINADELALFRKATSKIVPIIEKEVGKELVAQALQYVAEAEKKQ